MSWFSQWFLNDPEPSMLVFGMYTPWLVILSLLVAMITSAMALQLAGMARISKRPAYRQLAIGTGALALGGGVWSMHFIGMLAFQLCATVSFEPALTLLSILPSFAASWVALMLLARREIPPMTLIGGGVLVGAGIGAMHYSGMAAMQMAPLLRYDPWIFVLSILVAVALAILALYVRFGLRGRLRSGWTIIIGGMVMGLAISGMHYTGMAAARFVGVAEFAEPRGVEGSFYLAWAIAMGTLLFAVLVGATNGLLRYRHLLRHMQNSQSRLSAILNTAVDGIITIDERGLIQDVNASVQRLFGWHASELVGRNIKMLMPEPHQSQHDQYLRNYQRTGEARIIGIGREVEGLHKDGRHIPMRLSIGQAHYAGQRLYVGVVTDISAHKAMERALRDSELQYRSLISNIPGVSFRCLVDERWSMLFISDAIETLTGWPAQDFIQRRRAITELIHPDDLERLAHEVQDAIKEGRKYTVEYRLFDRQGQEHWIWESGCAVCDEQGVPTWIDGVLLDQTETKLRNAEYEGKVHAISKAMAMMEFDLDGYILDVNENAQILLGYDRNELIGQHHRMLCGSDATRDDSYRQLWTDLRMGIFRAGEHRRFTRFGAEIWIQAIYNPILDADGKPFKVVKLATDLTPRRLMEQELRTARDRAEQAAAARSSFLANMSHEIRTPMNAIMGFTELLLDTPLQDDQRRHLRTVQHASRSLLSLLNDILDTAKLDRGVIELESLNFSLLELCEQVCAALRVNADKKQLPLTLHYGDRLGTCFKGDPLRIQQVLTNLLGNAIKFTERGEVALEVSGEPGAVRFTIRDTGIGIPEDRLDAIFDPFAQADASMSRRFGGTGLGTTISRQLVELMGGHIRVSSRLGEGSTFIVDLPLEPGVQADAQPMTPQNIPALPPLRILTADDVVQNLQLLTLNLQRQGHDVVAVSDGQAALEAFICQNFDIVIMDIQMPGTDGLEATRLIRAWELAHQRTPVPIIALTASVLDRDRQAALDAGMNGFAGKPLDMPALIAEMGRLLGITGVATVSVPSATEQGAFDWVGGVQRWGSPLQMVQAIRHFLQDQASIMADLATAVAQQDHSALCAQSHRLRGVAANLGLNTLVQATTALEQAAMRADKDQYDALVVALAKAMAWVIEHLPEIPDALPATRHAASQGPVQTPAALRDAAHRLHEALSRGGLDDAALNLLMQASHEAVWQAEAESLQRAIDDFDFERALRHLQTLQQRWTEEA